MLNHYVVEHHFTWFIALVVIADLQVGHGASEMAGAHYLLRLIIIDLDGPSYLKSYSNLLPTST